MENTTNSDDLVDLGEGHHQAGRLQEAESLYRKALQIDPGHPGALYFLAGIAYDDGRFQLATQLIQELLYSEPNDVEAWNLLGMVAIREAKYQSAIECFKKAIALQPAFAQAHYNLGDALGLQGDVASALASFQQAVVLNPKFSGAHFALGNAYFFQGQLDQAIASYQKAINENPKFELAYLKIGQIFRVQKKLAEAIASFRLALVELPNAAAILIGLGSALSESEQYAEAILSFERAISLDPNCTDAYLNLGVSLLEQRKFSEAVVAFTRLVELAPQNPHAWMYLANAFNGTGKAAKAIDCWRKVIALDPNFVEPHQLIINFSQYLPDYSRENVFADHVAFGERFEAPIRKKWPEHLKPVDSNNKRLRVGFVSGDLYSHPVGIFLEGVLRELRRRDAVDIFIYSMNIKEDEVTDRLRAATHAWLSVTTLPDNDLEKRIIDDRVDILVDLSGHTNRNRLLVFAHKPAPIQVTWLGYWETTGLQAIDYILCDRCGVHDDEESFFVETPWYLPNTRLCFTLPDEYIAVAPLPALNNGIVTFGCFNNLLKITDQVVSAWSRILKRVPNGRLLLKCSSFNDLRAREEVVARFVDEGISIDRLRLDAASSFRDYLSTYNSVDIALDPFPFPGGTVSVQGIWMGVPMITLRGDRIISRQGESILRNLGLQDWIAESEDAYVELAVRKAADVAGLAKLRGELRQRLETSPLCDTQLFAKNLEDAFRQMWEKYCDAPAH